ncbi:uncharacterized protein LOC142166811 [Nicotiana tabacum]|uniref:Uncharacterized protein LOC142166811 n=1 Tax=Nicotiana tabacum TaxID=4097 RepID=A0AC58SBH6_TOBAC
MGFKRNDFPLIKAFIAMVKIQFKSFVQIIRSDNAFELGSSNYGNEFFIENGIIHQTSCPHTPQQNGVIERKHRYLLETLRALLFHSHLPIKFLGDCVLTATYLINRFPSKLLNNKTPFELLFGQPPSYNHIKTFGCLCFTTVPKYHRDKFQPRADPCVFLGYPLAKKGYKLYNLKTKLTLISRDVVFHEIFPFAPSFKQPSAPPPLNPVPSWSLLVDNSLYDPPYPHQSPVLSPSTSVSPSPPSQTSASFPSQPSTSSHTPPAPRRSSRTHIPPAHLKQYVCNLPPSLFGLHSLVNTVEIEPGSYQQAASIPAWQEAMWKEFEALEANHTWSIVQLPPGKKPIDWLLGVTPRLRVWTSMKYSHLMSNFSLLTST